MNRKPAAHFRQKRVTAKKSRDKGCIIQMWIRNFPKFYLQKKVLEEEHRIIERFGLSGSLIIFPLSSFFKQALCFSSCKMSEPRGGVCVMFQ